MKHKLPGLKTCAILLLLLGIRAETARAQDQKSGDEIVRAAATQAFKMPAIEAKFRQRVRAFGQEVAGSGTYAQLTSGQQRLMRLEMKMQVGEESASFLEICGRQDLWIRRHVPPADPRLEHVNLTRIRASATRLDDESARRPGLNWIQLGGLSRLLDNLLWNFSFSSPEQARLADIDVLVLRGEWRPERLQALSGQGKKNQHAAASQLPSRVILVLGSEDDVLPLFPYRIEYRQDQLTEKPRQGGAGEGGPDEADQLLSLIEFYEVQEQPNLKPELFEYSPGDEESNDRTQAYLRRLGK